MLGDIGGLAGKAWLGEMGKAEERDTGVFGLGTANGGRSKAALNSGLFGRCPGECRCFCLKPGFSRSSSSLLSNTDSAYGCWLRLLSSSSRCLDISMPDLV